MTHSDSTVAHLLPFSVDRQGQVNEQVYFQQKLVDGKPTVLIRGRALIGTEVVIPNDTEGYIWQKQPSMDIDAENDNDNDAPWLKTDTSISQFILWKKDTAPSPDDARLKALNGWINVAEAIHEPIPLDKDPSA